MIAGCTTLTKTATDARVDFIEMLVGRIPPGVDWWQLCPLPLLLCPLPCSLSLSPPPSPSFSLSRSLSFSLAPCSSSWHVFTTAYGRWELRLSQDMLTLNILCPDICSIFGGRLCLYFPRTGQTSVTRPRRIINDPKFFFCLQWLCNNNYRNVICIFVISSPSDDLIKKTLAIS